METRQHKEKVQLSFLFALPIFLIAPVDAAPAVEAEADGRSETVRTLVSEAQPDSRLRWGQVVVEQRVIIRIPARSRTRTFSPTSPAAAQSQPGPTIVWRETKAPKCLEIKTLRGVRVTRDDSIDLLTSERQRLRARLNEDCRTLDFYSGFYVERTDDGMICAERDVIQARSGARCEIDEFRLMVPVAVRD